jgi:hypothetical protein
MSLLTELWPLMDDEATNMSALTGLEKSVFIGVHLWLKIQTPLAPFVQSKLVFGRSLPPATLAPRPLSIL